MKATPENRGNVGRIWSDELDRSLAIAHNPFTLTRTPMSVAPLQYRDRGPCFMSDTLNFWHLQRFFKKFTASLQCGREEVWRQAHHELSQPCIFTTRRVLLTALFVCISSS